MVRTIVSILILGAGIYGTLLAIQSEWVSSVSLANPQSNAGNQIRDEAAYVSGASQAMHVQN